MIPHAENPKYATGAAKRQGLGGLLKHGIVMINLKSGEFGIYRKSQKYVLLYHENMEEG